MSRISQRPSAATISEEDFSGAITTEPVALAIKNADQPPSTTQKWADRWVSRLRSDAAKSSCQPAGSPLSRR